jgi:hypothetical protein
VIHQTSTFAAYQQPTNVTPPSGSVESWNGYQSYDPHAYGVLSPTASPYGTFTHQYATYDNQLFPVRPYDYDSPSRTTNGLLVDGTNDSHHHKTDYSSIEDGNDA